MDKKNIVSFVQFLKFGVVGLSNTVLSYIVYAGALFLFQSFAFFRHYDYQVAWFISYIVAVAWSFYWNKRFVFKSDDKGIMLVKTLLKTYCTYAITGLLLASFLSYLWVEILLISKWVSPVFNLIITVPLNFILNKYWTFKK